MRLVFQDPQHPCLGTYLVTYTSSQSGRCHLCLDDVISACKIRLKCDTPPLDELDYQSGFRRAMSP